MKNQPSTRNRQPLQSGTQYQPKAPFRRSLGSILATVVLILTAISLTNCAAYTAASTKSTGSTNPGTGILAASATTLSFGNVAVGSTAAQSLSITNTGTGAVDITQTTTSGTGFTVTAGSGAATLAVDQSATIQVQFAPSSTAAATANLVVASDASNPALTIALSGTGAQAGISLTPSSVNFGSVAAGASATQAITLKNTGTASLVVSSESVTGAAFSVTSFTPQTLTSNSSMTFNAVFAPTSSGAVSGSISVTTNLSPSTTTISLSGTGTQAAISVTPPSVSFGSVIDGASGSQVITLKDTGTANLVVSSESVTGTGFSVTGFAAQTLSPNGSMTFTAVFAPTSAGTVSGSITVSTSLSSPTTIALTGAGTQPAMSITPPSVTFGTVVDGNKNSQTITVKNTGTVNLVVSSQTVTGAGFSVTGFTSQTITPNNTMSFDAVFGPTTTGAVTGSISLTTNASASPTAIGLTGTGATATFVLGASPTTLPFGSVNVGSNGSLPVTLTNNGNSSITISGISGATGGFSTSGVNAGTILTPNQSATLNVTFTPTGSGAASATINVASNSTTAPSISASGTGIVAAHSASLSWAPSSTPDIVGYNVYRGTVSGGPYTKLTSSPITSPLDTDSTVSSGLTYYYVVTAVDSSNNESADSNQAVASIP